MLTNRSFFATLALGSVLFAGCTIKATETNNTVGGGAGGGYTTTTTDSTTDTTTDSTTDTTTTTSGMGGMGGMGQGGQGVGGQPECLGMNGSGMTDAVCDDAQKTPIAAGSKVCDDQGGISGSNPPPGIAACHGGFQLWVPAAAEALWYCIAQIGVEPSNACDPQQVQNCVSKVSGESCTDASASVCQQIKDNICPTAGDAAFDVASCTVDIAPWQDQPMVDLGTCMSDAIAADPALGCQAAYQGCFDSATGN